MNKWKWTLVSQVNLKDGIYTVYMIAIDWEVLFLLMYFVFYVILMPLGGVTIPGLPSQNPIKKRDCDKWK